MKRLLALAALAVSVAALPAATAGPATAATAHAFAAAAASVPAATGYNRCPKWRLCVFNLTNGQGAYCVYQRGTRSNAVPGCGFEQKHWLVRSVWDRHLYPENLYALPGFGAFAGTIGPGKKKNLSFPEIIYSFRPA